MQINEAEIKQILIDLIQFQSIVHTEGEAKLGEMLYQYLASWPYFQQHNQQLKLLPTYGDERERYNVLAYVKGEASYSEETVMLMGHFDTVGISDYGMDQHIATKPEQLKEKLLTQRQAGLVYDHLQSDDWLFGRGSLDMKSGVASHLYLLKYFAEHPTELTGNLVLVLTCDEENDSVGIRSALKDLKLLKDQEGFSFIAAINSDYTSPRYTDDPHRYVYIGSVGKLLPTFFIAGKETHVGQAFEGFDPNLVISELTREIDYNPLLCDFSHGEWTLPPVTLKQTDIKPFYDVQTPLAAFVYYNFFVHSWTPEQVLNMLKGHATKAFERAVEVYQERYRLYEQLVGTFSAAPEIKPRVFTFSEYYAAMCEHFGDTFETAIGQLCWKLANEEKLDIRQFACRIVEEVWKWDPIKEPVIILFYANLYYPRREMKSDNLADQRLLAALEAAVDWMQPQTKNPIMVRNFFPYISDMSFVGSSDTEESLQFFEANMPTWGEYHRLNIEDIQSLDIPVCNIGPYGFDAHKKYERVQLSYSLEVVPKLTYYVIKHLLDKK